MKLLERMSKELGLSVAGLIIIIVAFIISGTWVVFIPIALIVLATYFVYQTVDNIIISAILSYYCISVLMSVCGLLIHYFPNTIGGGLFEAGYILADVVTLSNIFDLLLKIKTDAWGITYNWIMVGSCGLIACVWFLYNKSEL